MSNAPRKVTRSQLAEFLPDPRAIRAFEQVVAQVSDITPANISALTALYEEAQTQSDGANTRAQQALDSLARIAQALELLSGAAVGQQNNSVVTDYIDFGTASPAAYGVGRLWWDVSGTLNIGMGNGNITQQVGEEFFLYGKATAAVTEGQLVAVTGVIGASGAVTFAPAPTGLLDPNVIAGVATENIALNGFGRVTVSGVVHAINTTGTSVGEVWADGDVLWYNTGFVGGMTKVKPVAPNQKTQVGTVLSAGASGSIAVGIVRGSSLGGTNVDVQIAAVADKNLLQYDAALGYWKNVTPTSTTDVAGATHAATSKVTPVDADEIPLADSAASFVLKKLTWANLKATLATWIGGNLIAGSFTSLVSSTTGKVATTLGVGGTTPSASGAGISFPATQSASTDPNTLDDYEEGTWTPTQSGITTVSGTPAYSGKYTKVGNVVTCTFDVTGGVVTTTAVTSRFTNLPFTTASDQWGVFGNNTSGTASGNLLASGTILFLCAAIVSASTLSGTITYRV